MFSFCRASCWLEKRGENILTKTIIPLEWDVASIMAMPNFLRTLYFYSIIAWGSDLFMTVSHVCVSLYVKACLMKDIACFRHWYKLPATNSNYSTLLSLKVCQVSYVPPYVTQCFGFVTIHQSFSSLARQAMPCFVTPLTSCRINSCFVTRVTSYHSSFLFFKLKLFFIVW